MTEPNSASPAAFPEQPPVHPRLADRLTRVGDMVPTVWPLADSVAINPYAGLTDRRFLQARDTLRAFCDADLLMPLAYYAERFVAAAFDREDIRTAIAELTRDGAMMGMRPSAERIEAQLATATRAPTLSPADDDRGLRTIAEFHDRSFSTHWSGGVVDLVSKFCAVHYDEGQAAWPSPHRHLPVYQAWRTRALADRSPEVLGLTGFRRFVRELPRTPEATIADCLARLDVPDQLHETFLLCQAFSIPGWAAWAKQRCQSADGRAAEISSDSADDLVGLIAIRLAHDTGLAQAMNFGVRWEAVTELGHETFLAKPDHTRDDVIARFVCLRASEIAFRSRLLAQINPQIGVGEADEASEGSDASPLAQMVFCIDVRSEPIRRHLESQSAGIETFGFAGFFGMPIEYIPYGKASGASQVPVLLRPTLKIRERFLGQPDAVRAAEVGEIAAQLFGRLWQNFQASAIGCFSFVETMGLVYGGKIVKRNAARAKRPRGNDAASVERGPTLDDLAEQGFGRDARIDLAESVLRTFGLTESFAPLVVFCGHESRSANNPLAASLDCGACGGHSGEPNARFAARLFNDRDVRVGLADRGIVVPDRTHFVAAVHNTTTDAIDFHDLDCVPEERRDDLKQLRSAAIAAGDQTRSERAESFADATGSDELLHRSVDWSEIRPEWGLTGNASLVIGPRQMTVHGDLHGQSFLHSYDAEADPDGATLAAIMAAPMIVSHLINMQYYASTVDAEHFGSGSKTIHNVVGRIGILSGTFGDLRTGLPIESLHDGDGYQHHPRRLQVVIAAPRERISRILNDHPAIANLPAGGWLHLIAAEDGQFHRYGEDQDWHPITQRKTLLVSRP